MQDDTCRIGEQVWLSTIPQEAVSLMRGPLGPVLRELSDKAASPLLLSCKGQHFCLAVPLPEKDHGTFGIPFIDYPPHRSV